MAQNHRRADRQPSYLGGKISYNQNLWTEDCVVRNASATGAKLTVKDPRTLPDQFNLTIPSKGETYRARIKWRQANQIGVAFERDQSTPVIELETARRLRARIKAIDAGETRH
jgi:hypothetical protein